MQIYDKLTKPILEVNYLRAENVTRYRVIIRYFLLEYEKINYWLHKEDIYEMMKELEEFQDYTMDQCQQDLQSLVDWGNLTAYQDSQKVKTIEDFKNRKYRYQLSEYTVEIERMTLRLENLTIEGASLEPTLIERIYQHLLQLDQIKQKEPVDIHGWLQYLMNDFIRLNQNYQDYIKTLNSAKAEELMKTTEFLVFKDKLISYLRTFVKTMQETGTLIALQLENLSLDDLTKIFEQATDYEMSIPRIDVELNKEDVYENFKGKWQSFHYWFVGREGTNEMDRLNDITNEIIRKITRYAQQIAEMNNRGSNRKEQYDYLAKIFMKCKDINEAHCLSAYVFGVADCLHLNHIQPQMTENIHQGVYEESPSSISFDSHSRVIRKKSIRTPAKDYSLERKMQQLELEQALENRRQKMNALICDGVIDFKSLPIIDAITRKTLLQWLSKGLSQADKISKTDDGDEYMINQDNATEDCIVHCEDGHFMMPAFQIVFKEKKNEQ
ncbi:MAG: TIGR02677 family protein [Coprobacillus cateniformis]|uniref:TIGR02677 family protein n=1 Tax=Longibaculum muris TaxID=1796628 RepID=UPI0029FEC7FB|nr:TIGR02677 family protein [Coprobacillus cateniformis]